MKPRHIQSQLRRNAKRILSLENDVQFLKDIIKTNYEDKCLKNYLERQITKDKKEIKALATLQKELKEDLHAAYHVYRLFTPEVYE